jgi:hypothetical protein
MATVTGTIKFSSDEAAVIGVTFVPLDTPGVIDSNLVIAQRTRIVTGSSGAFSLTLAEGAYTVLLDNEEEFNIAVPSGSASHAITSLIDVDAGSSAQRFGGVVDPEGVVHAPPDSTYLNRTTMSFWVKQSGTGTTGWRQLL